MDHNIHKYQKRPRYDPKSGPYIPGYILATRSFTIQEMVCILLCVLLFFISTFFYSFAEPETNVILNLKRQRLTHRNPKTTTTAAVTTTTEASLPQMQNQDIKNDDSDPRSRLKLDKNDRLYPYMGSLNLCIPMGKEYASDCHHLDGTTDVDLEGCKDFMYGQGGNTINFKEGSCWVKQCRRASIRPDHGQGQWNVYSTLCSAGYDWDTHKVIAPIAAPRQISEPFPNPIDFKNRASLDNRSIFVVFATFREKRCVRTLHSMYTQAKRPDLLYVGIFQQHHPDDLDCKDWSEFCPNKNEEFCKYKDHVRITRVHSDDSKGPAVARGYAEELYEGEEFTLQVDAHCTFVHHWDSKFIDEFFEVQNEYAVFSTYPKAERDLDRQVTSCPVICNSMIQSTGMLRNDRANEMPLKGKQYLSPFWAAGLSFSRGHRITNVPNDKYMDFLFDGEESDIAMRLFTHGYDVYAPRGSYVYHYYTSPQQNKKKKIKKFWDEGDWNFKNSVVERARRRFFLKIGDTKKIEKYIDINDVSLEEITKFGIGTQRTVQQWLDFAGINFAMKSVLNRCNDIRTRKLKRMPTRDEET